MNLIKLVLVIVLVVLLSSCSYHSNTYPAELKNPKTLTNDFLEGSKEVSIRNDEVDFPDWSFRFFGKHILPKLDEEQKIYVKELDRLRKISKQQKKIAKLIAKKEIKLDKYEKKIEKINNFPQKVDASNSNWDLWLFTRSYKKIGYEYEYDEKNLFWGLVKWGKRRKLSSNN